jgi:hypothetical protein
MFTIEPGIPAIAGLDTDPENGPGIGPANAPGQLLMPAAVLTFITGRVTRTCWPPGPADLPPVRLRE